MDPFRKTVSRFWVAVQQWFSDEQYAAAGKIVAAAFKRDHPEWQLRDVSRPGREGNRLIFYIGYDWTEDVIVQIPAPVTVYEYDFANDRACELSPAERIRYLGGRK